MCEYLIVATNNFAYDAKVLNKKIANLFDQSVPVLTPRMDFFH
jgi:hypothetical protein